MRLFISLVVVGVLSPLTAGAAGAVPPTSEDEILDCIKVFLGKGIVLLAGGLIIGWIAGEEGVGPIGPLFFDLFKGVLALFLMEMGLIVARQLKSLRTYGLFLLGFGVIMPLFSSVVGALLGLALGLPTSPFPPRCASPCRPPIPHFPWALPWESLFRSTSSWASPSISPSPRD